MLSNSSCQDVGFICPFVVIDPTDLGATTAVARNLPRRGIPACLPFGIKASCVWVRGSNAVDQRWCWGGFLPDAALLWLLAQCWAAVAACPMLCGCGFLLDVARQWLLARCYTAVAACPMLHGSGFLPYAALQWLLAQCCVAAASCDASHQWLRCHLSSNVLSKDSKGWKVSKFWKCRAKCGELRTNVDKGSELASIVEEMLLQWGNVEGRMWDGRESKVRSSSFFYQNMVSTA